MNSQNTFHNFFYEPNSKREKGFPFGNPGQARQSSGTR